MSRFYDAVDESLSLISARSPNRGEQEKRGEGKGEWHGSTSRQAVNFVVPPGQVRTTSANRSSRSPRGIRVRCCLPCVCGRYPLYSLFLPHSPTPLASFLTFAFLAQHSFGFLIYAQFNLRFLFYLKLIIYYFFLLRFLLAFGN